MTSDACRRVPPQGNITARPLPRHDASTFADFADERAGFIPLTRKIAASRASANSDSSGRSCARAGRRAWNWPISGEPPLCCCSLRIGFCLRRSLSPQAAAPRRHRRPVYRTRAQTQRGDTRRGHGPWGRRFREWNESRTNRARIADSGASEFVLSDMWYRPP